MTSIRARRPLCAIALVSLASAAAFALNPDAAAAERRCAGAKATHLADPLQASARGSQRDDVISGTAANDKVVARRGDDRVCAYAGRDLVKDGPGADRVRAGGGRDRVRAGGGRDRVSAGAGPDTVAAADGARDRVSGGEGRDAIRVRDGVEDSVSCGPGRDTAKIDNHDVLKGCEAVKLGGMADYALPPWADAEFADPSTYTTVQTNDFGSRLVARSPAGLETYRFDTSSEVGCPGDEGGPVCGQWVPLYGGADPILSDDGGWAAPEYYSTIQPMSFSGIGGLIARAGDGVHSLFIDDSPTWEEGPVNRDLSDAAGWGQPQYYETIQAASIGADGGGDDSLVARAPGQGLVIWNYEGDDWSVVGTNTHPFDDGWDNPQYYSTIQSGDLDGDGFDEMLGRAADGLHPYQY
jgi:RTX calcium-binding nonapeptide repeat (4 copies)